MEQSFLELTPQQRFHKQFMEEILKSVSDLPIVLKGGTALMLAYGLDRFSEDLDFDCEVKLRLDSKIEHSAKYGISLEQLTKLKDTDTATRYRARYKTKEGNVGSLKIEVSHRSEIVGCDVEIRGGVRVYSIGKLLDLKLLAAHDGTNPRTVVRDLYDIDYIARAHPQCFTLQLAERLRGFASDPDVLVTRYAEAYQEDDIVKELVPLDDLAVNISYSAHAISDRARAEQDDSLAQPPTMTPFVPD